MAGAVLLLALNAIGSLGSGRQQNELTLPTPVASTEVRGIERHESGQAAWPPPNCERMTALSPVAWTRVIVPPVAGRRQDVLGPSAIVVIHFGSARSFTCSAYRDWFTQFAEDGVIPRILGVTGAEKICRDQCVNRNEK